MRRRILLAIGSGSLAGLGCVSPSAQGGGNLDGRDPTRDGGSVDDPPSYLMMDADASTKMMPPVTSEPPTHMQPPTTEPTPVACEFGGQPVQECFTHEVMVQKARFGCGQIPIEPEPTEAEIDAKFLDNGCLRADATCDGCCNPAAAPGIPMDDGGCCYAFCAGACCGRPLVVEGSARVANVAARSDWGRSSLDAAPAGGDPALRARIADAWLQDARMEHASIASFARFGLELLAFGAPAELVEAAQQAALDEVAHARDCFALAQRYSGVARGPAPLDLRGAAPHPTLRQSVRAALAEGCIGETQAAGLAAAALEHATDPAVRAALQRIAQDEMRHAELAWRYVAWALQTDPSLASEVRQAITGLPGQPPTAGSGHTEEPAVLDAMHAAGRLGEREQAHMMAVLAYEVVRPCAEALLDNAVS